jgi:uncharacterized protein
VKLSGYSIVQNGNTVNLLTSNIMIKPLLISTLLLITACGTVAQTPDRSGESSLITIDATGEYHATADILHFTVNLNRVHEEARTAFEEHKELEEYLVNLLKEKGIPEEKITANPINITPRRHGERQGFETRQMVTIELDDVGEFESMQMELISNGFDNFSGSFGSTGEKEAREEALRKAIENARHKANILAGASDRELGEVKTIDYSDSSGPIMRGSVSLTAMEASDGGLLQFERNIPVREQVRVTFYLSD